MKIARIPLQAGSRFHFGEFRIDVNVGLTSTSAYAHSDTLFSALINCAASLGFADDLVKAFDMLNINISSLFYYLKRQETVIYFLPKPVFIETDNKIDGNHKKRNKIKFVSFGAWVDGLKQSEWLKSDKYVIIQDEFVLLKTEYNCLFIDADETKVRVYEITQSPKSPIRKIKDESIYYQTDIIISDNGTNVETGFYFFYETENEETEYWFRNATNVLSKTGIGGEHNNMGQKMDDPIFSEVNFGKINNSNFTNISLIGPSNVEEYNNIELYKTIIRGGRQLASGSRYKVVRFIQEGAKLKFGSTITGQLIAIGKDDENNTAYRNGKAFLIPVNL